MRLAINMLACEMLVSLVLLVSLRLAPIGAAKGFQVVDEDGMSGEAIARLVCNDDGATRQLSRFDSITKLRAHFDLLPDDNELSECKSKHHEVVKLLDAIVTTRNDNVCSDEKVSLIVKFHSQFISTKKPIEDRLHNNLAPLVLRAFYIHYAAEVNSICRRTMVKYLDSGFKERFPKNPELQLDSEDIINQLGTLWKGPGGDLLKSFSIKKSKNILLLWPLIEKSALENVIKSESLRDTYDDISGEPVRLMVKMKSIKSINIFKSVCHFRFKPIYKELIIPVVRLYNLGFPGVKNERASENARRWYAITQFCEAVLPIKFYEDPSLKSKDCELLSPEEAAKLEGTTVYDPSLIDVLPLVFEPIENTFTDLAKIQLVGGNESSELLIKNFDSQFGMRIKNTIKVLKLVLSLALRSLKLKAMTIFISKKGLTGPEVTEDVSMPVKTDEDLDKVELDYEVTKVLDNMKDEDLMLMNGGNKKHESKKVITEEKESPQSTEIEGKRGRSFVGYIIYCIKKVNYFVVSGQARQWMRMARTTFTVLAVVIVVVFIIKLAAYFGIILPFVG